MSWVNSKLCLLSSVHSMVNLDETTLYTGMEYGADDTWTTWLLLRMDTTGGFDEVHFVLTISLVLADESRENYRDTICSVMRQLLRKCCLWHKDAVITFFPAGALRPSRRISAISACLLYRLHSGALGGRHKVSLLHYQGEQAAY